MCAATIKGNVNIVGLLLARKEIEINLQNKVILATMYPHILIL
jgi:hypothetical protein